MRLFLGKPSIALTGFMFTGKSSVGRWLARELCLEFVDLDEEIVRRAGRPIEEIFTAGGEQAFREFERKAAQEILPVAGRVISTGGGLVIDDANRSLVRQTSCVVWLTATAETILERFRTSRGKPRPLLDVPDPAARVAELLGQREPFYRDCDLMVATDGRLVEDVCAEIIGRIGS
ncbi:MAG: shikimate kinase [Candidatus Glassbacteria bacterium]